MKKALFALIISIVLAGGAFAQAADTVTVRAGKQSNARHSRLKIRFIEVTEDSRCPAGVNCVWAGNAHIKFEVANRAGGSKVLEANTSVGPKGDQFDGWAIELTSLTPLPTTTGKPKAKQYAATFTFTRLQR